MATKNGHALLDDELVEQLQQTPHEESIIAGYERGKSDESDKVNFAQEWFPDKDQWAGKTIINPSQAKALAVARNLAGIFPELQQSDATIQDILDKYEVYLTSIEGNARNQHELILRAAFGDQSLPEHGENQSVTIFQGNEDNE